MRAAAGTVIDAGALGHRELNGRIRSGMAEGVSSFTLRNVMGHRYIGGGVKGSAEITIEGIPGNDLACFMAGPRIVVRGNAQDGVANTMGSGEVIVHGDAGDVLGYGMRGGRLLIRGSAGYRVGIHMKQYRQSVPVVMVGGTVRDYCGEYMAGGTMVVLGEGRREGEPVAGGFLGTGMHGGEIFIRGPVEKWQLGREVGMAPLTDGDWGRLGGLLGLFCREFGLETGVFKRPEFSRLSPVSLRPYGQLYVY